MKKTEKDKTSIASTIDTEEAEYNRLRNLFSDCDANMLALLDGMFWEAARLRVELNALHREVKKKWPGQGEPAESRIAEREPGVQGPPEGKGELRKHLF